MSLDDLNVSRSVSCKAFYLYLIKKLIKGGHSKCFKNILAKKNNFTFRSVMVPVTLKFKNMKSLSEFFEHPVTQSRQHNMISIIKKK